jgi:hypothetical protein
LVYPGEMADPSGSDQTPDCRMFQGDQYCEPSAMPMPMPTVLVEASQYVVPVWLDVPRMQACPQHGANGWMISQA